MPPTDKPVELSEVERLLTALGQNASGWAGPVRLLWRYAKALVAEVAALRTENDELRDEMEDWQRVGRLRQSTRDDELNRLTAQLALRDQACQLVGEECRRLRAELAAERARHETTRAAVLDEVHAAVRAVAPKYLNPDRPNPLVESGFAQCKEAVYAALRALAAASPSPVAGQEVVHACPPEGSGVMPCCGRTPFEVSRTDRIALLAELVTCPVAGQEAGT